MQDTRLNTLVNGALGRFELWFRNPWRRVSLLLLSLLFGNFLATAIATTAGQKAELDVLAGVLLVTITESINWFYYRRARRFPNESVQRSLFSEILNTTKIGLIYGLFLEAFKLGS